MPPKPRLIEVLLIEDNPGDVHLIREGLKQSVPDLRLNLRTAADGEEALAIRSTRATGPIWSSLI